MKVKIENSELTIRVPLNAEGTLSRSGKSSVLASSRGQQFIGKFEGKPIFLQLNVLRSERGGDLGARVAKSNVIEMVGRGQGQVHSHGRKGGKSVA
jgi:hypothetical protein